MIDNDDFSLWACFQDYFGAKVSFRFRPLTTLSETAVSSVSWNHAAMAMNSSQIPSSIGTPYLSLNGSGSIYRGLPYIILFADYSSITPSVCNLTYMPVSNAPSDSSEQIVRRHAIPANSGVFNTSLATLRGALCSRIFNMVSVDVTLRRSTRSGLNGSSKLLPWAVSAYDPSSLTNRR